VYACGEGQGSADVREPMDYAYENENAICLAELIYPHVYGCDARQRVDGNGCDPWKHVYANAYEITCMLQLLPVPGG